MSRVNFDYQFEFDTPDNKAFWTIEDGVSVQNIKAASIMRKPEEQEVIYRYEFGMTKELKSESNSILIPAANNMTNSLSSSESGYKVLSLVANYDKDIAKDVVYITFDRLLSSEEQMFLVLGKTETFKRLVDKDQEWDFDIASRDWSIQNGKSVKVFILSPTEKRKDNYLNSVYFYQVLNGDTVFSNPIPCR